MLSKNYFPSFHTNVFLPLCGNDHKQGKKIQIFVTTVTSGDIAGNISYYTESSRRINYYTHKARGLSILTISSSHPDKGKDLYFWRDVGAVLVSGVRRSERITSSLDVFHIIHHL